MSPPPGVAVDPDRLAGMGALVVDLSDRYQKTTEYIGTFAAPDGGLQGLLRELLAILRALQMSYMQRQSEHGKALHQTGDDCVESAKAYHKTESASYQGFWDWLGKHFDHAGDIAPHPDLSPMGFPPVDAPRLVMPEPKVSAAGKAVQALMNKLSLIDANIQSITGTSVVNGPLQALSGDWQEPARLGAAYKTASDVEQATADEYQKVVAGVDQYWQAKSAWLFGEIAQKQLDQVDAPIGTGISEVLKQVAEQGEKIAQTAHDTLAAWIEKQITLRGEAKSLWDWANDYNNINEQDVKDAVKKELQAFVESAKSYEENTKQLVDSAHTQLRALEMLLTGDVAWLFPKMAPGSPDLEKDYEDGGIKVAGVDGPTGNPPDIVGGQKAYYWEPAAYEKGKPGDQVDQDGNLLGPDGKPIRIPNVKCADLGVPVSLGTDKDGMERYAYVMGDTANADDAEHGGGKGRVAGNAVLMAHRDPKTKQMVMDGFMKDPITPSKPLELFPVEGNKRFEPIPPNPHRSLVPTSGTMVNGQLVLAWQQINWDDKVNGHEKGEGSWITTYNVDPSTRGINPTATNTTELHDPNFQQIQLTTYTDPKTNKEEMMIVGSAEARVNDGPHFARVDPSNVSDRRQWEYYDPSAQNSSSHGWGPPGQEPSHQFAVPGVPNVGEGSTRIIGNQIVMVYTDSERGVVTRSAPLDHPDQFGPPIPIVTGETAPGGGAGKVGDHYGEPGGNYGGFIQDVDEKNHTMTVMVSRWDPYGVYPVTVHYDLPKK